MAVLLSKRYLRVYVRCIAKHISAIKDDAVEQWQHVFTVQQY